MRVVSKMFDPNVSSLEIEVWLSMPSDSRYEVSNLGNVRNKLTGRIRKPSTTPTGYKVIVITLKHKKHKGVYVHREVMAAFKGACPEGFQVSHINGNNTDNRLSNICYETPIENMKRKKIHGTQTCGENHGTAKLKSNEVFEIRAKRQEGMKLAELAKIYNVSFQQISRICKKENWRM